MYSTQVFDNDTAGSLRTAESHVTRRFRAQPGDVAETGVVTGAALLDWIHQTAAHAAAEWSQSACVTTSVGNIAFERPVRAADDVTIHACVIFTCAAAIDVLVTVCTADGQIAQCSTVFVAVDDHGRTVEVPVWNPTTMLQMQRRRQARARTRTRTRIEDVMAVQSAVAAGSTPGLVLRCPDSAPEQADTGRILRALDQACRTLAATWAGVEVVTSYVAGIRFEQAVAPGAAVDISARLVYTGPRTIHCGVRVTDLDAASPRQLAFGVLVLNSSSESGASSGVRPWTPVSEQERQLQRTARELIDLRPFVEPFSTWAAVPA